MDIPPPTTTIPAAEKRDKQKRDKQKRDKQKKGNGTHKESFRRCAGKE
jgi:hypothetical protein